MPIRPALFALFLPAAAAAQEPLAAIEWLKQNGPTVLSGPVLLEPPVSVTALRPDVDVSALDAVAQPVGLVPDNVTGLPHTLWADSDASQLARLIANAPVANSPAMQTLLYTVLLSETRAPPGPKAAEILLLARIDRLLDLGATDPAQALAEQVGPHTSAALFERWFDATLLTGDEDKSCAVLITNPYLAPDYAARIFCAARSGDWQTAALTLEAAHALDLLPRAQLDLLDRFLSPDVFEGSAPLPAPVDPDPLTFRLFETIGERLPTASLPRAFATADLRDVAGWKSQLEASERLARTGALSPNRLLGLYTDRLPAASGGIWDRVHALQQFETALNANSAAATAKTLPSVWQAMRSVHLEVPFAALFADALAKQKLTNPVAQELAWHIRLLSADYEAAAAQPPEVTAKTNFLMTLAQGEPGRAVAPSVTAQAISDGFAATAEPPTQLQLALDAGQLGTAILQGIKLFDSGARGNPDDLTAALATFRAVGLEDTARRAALELMLLDRHRS